MTKPCHLCLGPHDQHLHDAIRRVRDWFRDTQVMPRPIQKIVAKTKKPAEAPGPFTTVKRYNRYEKGI